MSLSALAATALVAIGAAPAQAINPTTAAPARSIDGTAIAQAFPPGNSSQPVLSVVAQGQASGVADTAEVQLTFVNYSYTELFTRFSVAQLSAAETADPSGNEGLSSYLDELEPITQASLQPIIDRLVEAGIPASAIEVDFDAFASTGTPPFPETDSAQISLRLNRPAPAQIEAIQTAVESAIQENDKLFEDSSLISYTIADCRALEQEAYRSAIANAREQANQIAAAAGVTIAGTPSIAVNPVGFSDTLSACTSDPGVLLREAVDAATVEVLRSLTVTYPIR